MATNTIASTNMSSQNQKSQGLPNPYAQGSLPNPYALPTVAEAAPVKFTEEQAKPEDKKSTANRFHNPHLIKRPQAKVNTTAKKPAAPMPTMPVSASDAPINFQQRSLDYYKSTADDDAAILEANREARREQNRRKKDEKKFARMYGNWKPNEPYKLRYPTKIDAYKASGAYQEKLDEFREYLRAARSAPSRDSSSDDFERQQTSQSRSNSPAVSANPMFAPPSFEQPPTTSPAPAVPVAQTVDDAYEHRLRLAQQLAAAIPPPPPPPPPMVPPETQTEEATPPPPPAASYTPTISAPPVRYSATISAAPVHYARPPSSEVQMQDADEESNERPAKKQKTNAPPKLSKAAAMMAKMGYVKGQGLGKNNDGVTTHLEVKARKDQGNRQSRDEFDNDSKTVKSQQVFDIKGGLRAHEKDHGPFGEPSRVIVTWGCVDGVDFATDADRGDGGIRQEMGDAFNSRFGPVERIHVNLSSSPTPVYIQFQDPLCALNAVNRFHEGYDFQGRTIRAVFYDEAKFNNFIYDH